jgi:G3E family GTPase
MKTTVVTGLLGSGKTTFIRNFLKDRKDKAVVLVNDFGQAGIDGEIISAGGIEAIELPSGCVCCTLKFDLITSIQRAVKQFTPDHLLIEPSGVASPIGVLEAVESAGLAPPSVVGIVDGAEFAELYESGMFGNFFREQIESSDAILVNKVDIAETGAIEAAEHLIGKINPRAVLFRTTNAAMDAPLPEGARSATKGIRLPEEKAHCQFETVSFRLKKGVQKGRISKLFEDLAKGTYGPVTRAKALVQTAEGPWRFDIAFGNVDATRFEREIADSRLVVIGLDLRLEKLEQGLPTDSPS